MNHTPSPKILAIVNQKGGVGKTTTAVNLATALAAVGRKVLLIDLDPQGNASTGLGILSQERRITSYNLIIGDVGIEEAVVKTSIPKLSLVSANIDLSGAEIELVNMTRREFRLREALAAGALPYDYVLIDCPPSLGLVTLNALTASHAVLIPLQCEFYALEGLSHLLKTIELVRAKMNPRLSIQGIVLTMYDRRNKLTEQIEQDVRKFLGTQVYKTVIPRNVRMSEAPSHGKPALIYDLGCSGSQAYLKLAGELIKREKKQQELTAA
jgi:chromosome partitioning protein